MLNNRFIVNLLLTDEDRKLIRLLSADLSNTAWYVRWSAAVSLHYMTFCVYRRAITNNCVSPLSPSQHATRAPLCVWSLCIHCYIDDRRRNDTKIRQENDGILTKLKKKLRVKCVSVVIFLRSQ